jgi:hypothetical protein
MSVSAQPQSTAQLAKHEKAQDASGGSPLQWLFGGATRNGAE